MHQSGAGDNVTPFSGFTDLNQLSQVLKGATRPASPTTVSNIIELPLSQNKKALKSYLREKLFPVNHDIRTVLYKTLAKRIECNESMFGSQLYNDFIRETFPDTSSQYSEIPLPNIVDAAELTYFYLNDEGIQTLHKILACIALHFPQVSYSPVLGIAVALFLHYDDDPAQVFSHACRLIFASSKQAHYLDISKLETDASAVLLKDLSQRYTSSSHKSLLSLTSDPLTVYREWIRCLFHGLPFTYIVVLFDMYLLEGYKSLYRVSLAILKFYRKMGVSSSTDIVNAVFQFVEGIESRINVNLLFRKAFGFKMPPSKDVKKLHRRIQSNLSQNPVNTTELKHYRNPWTYLSLVRDVQSDIVNETLLSTLYCHIPEQFALYKPKVVFSTNVNGYSLQALYSYSGEMEPTILLIKTTGDEVLGAYLSSPLKERRETSGYFGTGETFIFSLQPEAQIYAWVEVAPKKGDPGRDHQKNFKVLPPVKPPIKSGKGITLPPIRYEVSLTPNTPQPRPVSESVSLPPLVGVSCSPSSQSSLKYSELENDNEKRNMFIMASETGLAIGGGGGYGLFVDASLRNGQSQRCATFANQPLVPHEVFVCSVVEVLVFVKE
ncbi:TBC1 domain family member 24-like [Clavelina lepadiformis]|uniref:TBC1 domain family member 24-like n=1 Tax=Clavelina lepadiformis TaxID=159417 RepID=UPI004041C6AE